MQSLSSELKQVLARRLEAAHPDEIAEIVGQLCASESPLEFKFEAPLPFRFIKGDDVVEDVAAGLIWTAGDVGSERLNWADAKAAASKLTIDGSKGWRLPTVKELLTLVDYDRSSPAINPIFSSCKSDWYWTSTPYASSPGDYAWLVHFSSGYSYYNSQNGKGLVRAVRARQ